MLRANLFLILDMVPNMRKYPDSILYLDEQICFPLYAASRLVTRLYHPLLEPMGITYPQYLVMLSLWQHGDLTVSQLCARTVLESNTLTPLLKKMEVKGLISRKRQADDERVVEVSLTKQGRALKKRALEIPPKLFESVGFPLDKGLQLRSLLKELVAHLTV